MYVITREAYDALMAKRPLLEGLEWVSLVPEHPTMELYRFTYRHTLADFSPSVLHSYIMKCFPGRAIVAKPVGAHLPLLPIEEVLCNAFRRGNLVFDNGRLFLSPLRPEREAGHFLHQLLHFYSFSGWADIDTLIQKRGRDGNPIPTLRKIRRFAPSETYASAQLDAELFFAQQGK